MIAIDTDLLVYAHRAGTAQHRAARRAIERASREPRGWGIAAPCVAEFWAVVTHPAARGGPSSAAQAAGFLRALWRAGGHAWEPGPGFASRLVRMAGEVGVRGVRIFDLQVALTALDNGAREIWTHDRQFVPVPGLRVRDPLAP
jgi:hypothetical protein